MAIIDLNVFSVTLMMNIPVTVVIPTLGNDTGFKFLGDPQSGMKDIKEHYGSNKKYPVLYLYGGLGSDHTDWIRYTNVERYASEKKLALVIPPAYNACNADMVHGNKFMTFAAEELPAIVRGLFPISDKREDTFISGMSLGSYAAFRLALSRPDLFGAAASTMGALNINRLVTSPLTVPMFENIFGDISKVPNSENDLFYLLRQLKENGAQIPLLFSGVGKDDPTLRAQEEFKALADELEIEMTCIVGEGQHDWASADTYIKHAIDWLPIKK